MPSTRFQRIAHPTDLKKDSEFAFYHALRIAIAAHARLDLIHVEKNALAMAWAEFPDTAKTLTQWGLSADALRSDSDDLVQTIATYGKEPVGPIVEYMDEFLPDLMVLATHRRHGVDRWLHKHIAQRLVQKRAVATIFVPYGEEGFVSPTLGTPLLRQVLLPVDWLPEPQAAIDAVTHLATLLGCDDVTFTLLHVSDKVGGFPAVNLPEREGWHWRQQTRSGDVVELVQAMAKEQDTDLVVMVTEGREGFLDALRGSTTERVLQGTLCPVLAVPALEKA